MIDWLRPEIISALALGVSIFSLAVTLFMAWRTAAAERPLAWVKLEPTEKADCWLATIHLRNRSKLDLRAHSVWVPITAGPVTRKQDFWMLDYGKELTTAQDGKRVILDSLDHLDRHLKVSFERSAPVQPGDTGAVSVLLIRSGLSAATIVKMSFCMEEMKPRPRLKTMSLTANIPSETLRMHISSA
jgi:hypothetical protein